MTVSMVLFWGAVIFAIAQIALTLYMFTVGLEFESALLRRSLKQAAAVSLAGILAPFALGIGAAILLHGAGGFFAPQLTVGQAALFMGASLSITAFPVMARIIHERGLTGTAIGTMALAAGAMDDVAAWLIFAVVVASFKGDVSVAVIAFAGAFAYIAIVFGSCAVPAAAGQRRRGPARRRRAFGTVLMLLMAGAWFTDWSASIQCSGRSSSAPRCRAACWPASSGG
jgi:Kef-type K+ transport system membrane component KefB